MAQCIRKIIEATNEQDRAERDLVAQTDMSLWALWMLVVSGFALALTTIGVWFVYETAGYAKATLAHTESANKAAWEMVEDSRKTVKFSEKAADVSREALIATDRPWIKVEVDICDALIFEESEISIKVRFTLRNIGRSPATNVSLVGELLPDAQEAAYRAEELSRRGMTSGAILFLGIGQVLFPDDAWISDDMTLDMPLSDFARRRLKVERVNAKPVNICPAILAGASYIIPGDKRLRYTYLPFEIRPAARDVDGWDGSPCECWPEDIELKKGLMTGRVS